MPDQSALVGRGHRALRVRVAERCREITEARWFATAVFLLILGNAAVLGVETYAGVSARWHTELQVIEHLILAAFTTEMVLRAGTHATRPWDFFRDPWNLFDLVVVLAAFVPAARENSTILRLLRLARVLRAARFLPQLRIVLVAVGRSLPGTVSFLLVGALLLYVYAMVGWVFFAAHDPEHFGSIGRAVLTLFLLMTLDGLGDAVHAGLAISRWSFLYYVSYVLIASFVLVNVLIGVVINSLEEAREIEKAEMEKATEAEKRAGKGAEAANDRCGGDEEGLRERIAVARRALDDVESALSALPPPRAHARVDGSWE
ncbi:ion transporter [Streptomyces sp. P9(2023)]|uniref:ion transporter n=1 Tax=Streptomyces sp. P9(2023) TaxID=3064394 RepID=UPI0028F41209|nr:ion transporter [Streptomyces sp. P9(2023)]MDT9691264.1 ion transporter [Streptomyces sp. P9(2023)]